VKLKITILIKISTGVGEGLGYIRAAELEGAGDFFGLWRLVRVEGWSLL
jgi:hypothetical protein